MTMRERETPIGIEGYDDDDEYEIDRVRFCQRPGLMRLTLKDQFAYCVEYETIFGRHRDDATWYVSYIWANDEGTDWQVSLDEVDGYRHYYVSYEDMVRHVEAGTLKPVPRRYW